MQLNKLFNESYCQIYSISNPSSAFKKMYPKKYIFVRMNSLYDYFITNESNIDATDIATAQECVYVFTYNSKIPKKILNMIRDDCNFKNSKESQTSMSACLDPYYINDNPKINVIMSIYPRYNEICPLFNREIIIKANSKKLQLNELNKQLTEIVNTTIKAKCEQSKSITCEQWLREFLMHPFCTMYSTCCIYPDKINNNTVNKYIKCSINNIFITYDVRANNYNEELKLFSVIGEAFDKAIETVTVFDSYNGCLHKIMKALDKQGLKYKVLNDYAISTKYQNLKAINVKYELTDFI